MIDYRDGKELLEVYIKQQNLKRHCLAVEAVMREMARRLKEDEMLWGLTGLLHDLDAEVTAQTPDLHTDLTIKWLEGQLPQEALRAIQAHCGKVEPRSRMEIALRCADPVTGFIVACALMHPTRSLSGLAVVFLLKRFREKRFAAGASREQMAMCVQLGFTLEEFLAMALEAMQGIEEELGLSKVSSSVDNNKSSDHPAEGQ